MTASRCFDFCKVFCFVTPKIAENIRMGRKKSSIGCLFWIALVLLVLVVFLFNRKTIENVLDKTGLLKHLVREPDEDSVPEILRRQPDETAPPSEAEPDVTEDGSDAVEQPPVENVVVAEEDEPEGPPQEVVPPPEMKLRRATLYFVLVDGEGQISMKPVVRSVRYVDSPLTDTLKSLLNGLLPSEIGNGLLSLVPEGTEIKAVYVKNGIAFVDFNESFRFNSFGGEGYASQLRQIVYTATEFQTVAGVQILINGEKLSYLGPESPYIGEPLKRESL